MVANYIILILILFVWDFIWKGIGLWKSGRNNQLAWFVVILIFFTAGILPIIYLLFFQKREPRTIIRKTVRIINKTK